MVVYLFVYVCPSVRLSVRMCAQGIIWILEIDPLYARMYVCIYVYVCACVRARVGACMCAITCMHVIYS